MAWVVDTSVLLDLVIGDPQFEPASIQCLQQHLGDGLVVCPISFVELGPVFGGNGSSAEAFLKAANVDMLEPWTYADTMEAHLLWNAFQLRRRQTAIAKRPVADVMIAAFALRFQGIITRNAADFRNIAPSLTVKEP
jgi:predicted nucleic acid-binding protein